MTPGAEAGARGAGGGAGSAGVQGAGGTTPARRAAFEVLRATGRGRRLDLALAAALPRLPSEERPWTQELVYGTVRLRGRLDHLLDHHVRKGVGSLSPALLDVLRLGAYQILQMGGVPDYAAVSQAVDQARRMDGRGAAGLANAVLRAVSRDGDDPALFPDPGEEPAAWLATWGSHPLWLVERWLARWSFEDVRALVESDNRVPPLTLLPLDRTPAEAVEALARVGIDAEPVPGRSGCVALAQGTDPVRALETLPSIIQDPASALVTVYADPPEGAWVADLCAAPGGKALALSRRAPFVLAADRSRPRLALVRDNATRTGAPVRVVEALGERPPVAVAPMVLLDVPCTGTGTLRRHPDARWRLRPGDVPGLARVQCRILEGAAGVVSSGGVLVYSTCTLEPEENGLQVEAFLAEHPEFRLEPTDAVEPELLDAVGRLAVLPQRTGFDGAFAARLRRTR